MRRIRLLEAARMDNSAANKATRKIDQGTVPGSVASTGRIASPWVVEAGLGYLSSRTSPSSLSHRPQTSFPCRMLASPPLPPSSPKPDGSTSPSGAGRVRNLFSSLRRSSKPRQANESRSPTPGSASPRFGALEHELGTTSPPLPPQRIITRNTPPWELPQTWDEWNDACEFSSSSSSCRTVAREMSSSSPPCIYTC